MCQLTEVQNTNRSKYQSLYNNKNELQCRTVKFPIQLNITYAAMIPELSRDTLFTFWIDSIMLNNGMYNL